MIIKIDAGLGDIVMSIDGNLKLAMLLGALKDHIEIYGLEGLINFLSAEEGMEDLKIKIAELKSDIQEKDEEIDDLESELESVDDKTQTIDCGIGTINYDADNIALQDLMENLDTAIKKSTPQKVNSYLSQF